MFRIFLSKKGFSLTEIMIVVIVLGILTAIAVPAYTGVLHIQRKNECKNQRILIQEILDGVLLGMEDNGAPQKNTNGDFFINFNNASQKTTINYQGKDYNSFKLVPFSKEDENKIFEMYEKINQEKEKLKSENDSGKKAIIVQKITDFELELDDLYKSLYSTNPLVFRISDIRGGYWNKDGNSNDYKEGVAKGYFLKKKSLSQTPFYFLFNNYEIPVCAFSTEDKTYNYYILENCKVICTCPECQ